MEGTNADLYAERFNSLLTEVTPMYKKKEKSLKVFFLFLKVLIILIVIFL